MARTARQKAALRKAQLASARKRKGHGSSRKRKIAKGVAVVAIAGGVGYAVHKNRHVIKKKVRKKAENNKKVRETVAKDLLAKRRNSKRRPTKGLKLAKKYRMGRPDVRRRRKRSKSG